MAEKNKVTNIYIEIITEDGFVFFLLQEKFCNSGCVERFLKVKGENVKKAAKQLRNCLAWRDSLGTGNIFVFFFNYFFIILLY